MGPLKSKELSTPPSSTPAYFMSKNCIAGSYKYLAKGQNLIKNKLQWPLWGTFQLDKII